MNASLILPITSASEVRYYGMTVEMPFVPFIGLSVNIEGYAYTVASVSYHVDSPSIDVMFEPLAEWSAGGNWERWRFLSRQPYSRDRLYCS